MVLFQHLGIQPRVNSGFSVRNLINAGSGAPASAVTLLTNAYRDARKKAEELTEEKINQKLSSMKNEPTPSEKKIMQILSERDSMITQTRKIMQKQGKTTAEMNQMADNITCQYCKNISFAANMLCLADILNNLQEKSYILSLQDIAQLNEITR